MMVFVWLSYIFDFKNVKLQPIEDDLIQGDLLQLSLALGLAGFSFCDGCGA